MNKSKHSKLTQESYILSALEKLDPVTYKHSFSVANLAVWFVENIAHDLDLSIVYYSGLYHDIGKSQINETILNKPSKLTDEEFEVIKKHPEIGYNMLKHSGIPIEVLNAIRFHQERYDGKGYPLGLIAKEIPVLARIINICDVYDALTSDRPYRKGFSTTKTLQIMKEMQEQFDPYLFQDFVVGIERLLHYKEAKDINRMPSLKIST